MINGSPNDFLGTVYSGQDIVYIYQGIKYWFQGYTNENGTHHMEVIQHDPISENKNRYFIEWTDSGIDVFLMSDGAGIKISHITALERSDVLNVLFDFKLDGFNSLNGSYDKIEIVDIE